MSDEYQNYLKEIAAKNSTSSDLIDKWVYEAVGTNLKSKKRILAGEANEVYEVETADSTKVIVRLNRSSYPNFDQEKWAIEKCEKIGIPVPKVLLIKHQPEEEKVLSVCIQERLPGDTLERGEIDYWDLPDDLVNTLLHKSGELLAKMHSVKVSGFGGLNGEGRGEFNSLAEITSNPLEKIDSYLEMAQELELSESKIEKALNVLAKEGEKMGSFVPVLNHGDFAGKHIMYKGTTITGFIDFGEVQGHSPVFDFARWEYWFGKNKYFDWLREGYTDRSVFKDGYEAMSRLIQLDISVGTLWWYSQVKYSGGIERAYNKMNELLGEYL